MVSSGKYVQQSCWNEKEGVQRLLFMLVYSKPLWRITSLSWRRRSGFSSVCCFCVTSGMRRVLKLPLLKLEQSFQNERNSRKSYRTFDTIWFHFISTSTLFCGWFLPTFLLFPQNSVIWCLILNALKPIYITYRDYFFLPKCPSVVFRHDNTNKGEK